VICDVFDSRTLPVGMKREAPGGATLELRTVPMPSQPPKLAYDSEPIFTVVVSVGRDIGISLLSAWLYDKLKERRIRRIKINRCTIAVTPEGIFRAVEENIEITKE
jgi:hypothetical protein